MKKNVVVFLVSFVSLIIISSLLSDTTTDIIWNFGFSYNISNGLIPYKDFNMVIGPFYSLLIAAFLKMFGNYVIVFKIANSIIISFLIIPIYNKIKLFI